jgi:hypothetical protein
MRNPTVKIIALSLALVSVAFLTACEDKSDSNVNSTATNTSTNPDLTQPNPGLLLIVTPSKGPAAGGTEVKLTGENFTGSPKVFFGTAEAKNVKIVSKTEITATTPAGTKGKNVDITLQAPNAPSSTLVEAFTYQ